MRLWLLSVLTAFCACSLVAYSTILARSSVMAMAMDERNSPASLQCPGSSPSRQPKQSMQKPKAKTKEKKPATLHNGAHLRHSIRKKQNIGEDNFSSCKDGAHLKSVSSIPEISHNRCDMTLLTLSHKIFQVMPLDIVGEIPNIDPAVLLGRLAH